MNNSGAPLSITPGTYSYENIDFAGSGQYSLGGSTMLTTGNLLLTGSSVVINSGTIEVHGNLSATSSGATGTVVVKIAGNAGGQTLSGSATAFIPNLEINSPNSVTFLGTLRIYSSYIWTSGASLSASGSTLSFEYSGAGIPIVINPGSVSYHNVTFNPSGVGNTYMLNSALNAIGGMVTVHNTTLLMSGFSLVCNAMDLSAGGIVTRGTGTLMVNGAGYSSGAFFGGTVNP